jgi:hypothetical protein
MDSHLLKGINTQKLESSAEFAGELVLLVKDGHHEINGYCNPDLILYRIGHRRSNWVCILIPALVLRKSAHGKRVMERSMVVESRA